MSIDAFDPEILQDFLTESGELLDELEGDLVSLEDRPDDPEMLNQVFRALHTIKGSASFLALTNLVSVAHAAESALNAARNGQVSIDRGAMDLLLDGVDTIKVQMQQIAAGEPLAQADPAVVRGLTELGEGRQPAGAQQRSAEASAGGATVTVTAPTATIDGGGSVSPLQLADNKSDLIDFLLADLDETLDLIDTKLAQLRDEAARDEASEALVELGESLARSAEFFEFGGMTELATLIRRTGAESAELGEDSFAQLMPRVAAVAHLLREQAQGLADQRVISRDIGGLTDRLSRLLAGEELDEATLLPADATPDLVLRFDGVFGSDHATPAAPPTLDPAPEPAQKPGPVLTSQPDASTPSPSGEPAATNAATAVEQTIRVEVGRLETLMNLVGELVLQKNRISSLTRQLESCGSLDGELREEVALASSNLDRVTSDMQVAVMRTRMQPLDKLFGKYPRLIRDLAKKTGKEIRLVIEGGDTEVDKSIIEELGDPLVHLLRNSADHGLEMPDARAAAGKEPTGTIRIVASHQGSHVAIAIIDDGKGISREVIARKAVERGLASEAEIAALSDRDVYRFIMQPGFSTAEAVTDLSGRGVGMDVVRTNIEALKGSIEIDSAVGQGTTITIQIPLTVAIMPAMMVGVEDETYAIPLSNLLEIVRPEEGRVSTIHGRPVLRLRDSILPLLSSHALFGLGEAAPDRAPFAVVLTHQERSFGLLVTRLIGQQEIVIKPLDEIFDAKGPMSGATVRDDGGVSLIVDVAQLARIAETKHTN
ncbi:MAG: chemotaxis protein CheA [Phycisphaerales bacterium]